MPVFFLLDTNPECSAGAAGAIDSDLSVDFRPDQLQSRGIGPKQ